jgi:23S rRNA (cytosine1962-C5)-methyltransferase
MRAIMEASTLPTLRLQPGRHRRAQSGHPWIYSNEIQMDNTAKALAPGSLVRLVDAQGLGLGVASFNPHTLIAGRLLDRNAEARIDTGWIAERLSRALAVREALFDRPFYRLLHAEADGLPATIVDRYGDVLVVQANTAGADRLVPELLSALDGLLKPRAIVLRNDSAARSYEGLADEVRVAAGSLPAGEVRVEENGALFCADLSGGQKTGWFFDQRDNRAFVARLAEGRRTVDFYTYTGGFGVLCAARGAAHVTLVDRSQPALDLALKAAALNGVADRVEARKADAFNELDKLVAAGATWEMVICDPPAFIKSKKDLAVGTRAYRKMTRQAAQLTAPGGYLAVASCSHNMDPLLFADTVAKALADVGRRARILRNAGAGPDHPVHPNLPESAYLKCIVMALD